MLTDITQLEVRTFPSFHFQSTTSSKEYAMAFRMEATGHSVGTDEEQAEKEKKLVADLREVLSKHEDIVDSSFWGQHVRETNLHTPVPKDE